MSDPTYPVLALGFWAVLVLSIIGIAIRRAKAVEADPVPPVETGRVATWFYRPADLFGPFILWLFWAAMIALQAHHELSADAKSLLSTEGKSELGPNNINAPVLLINIALQVMLAGAAAAVALRGCKLDQWLGIKWARWPLVFVIAPAAVLFMWVVFMLIESCGYMKWMESMGVEPLQDTVRLLQECRDPIVLGLLAFTAVIVAPICEELVFRGYLYPILKKYGGFGVSLIASSLLFGLAHGSLASLLPLCLLGALLATLYEKTGSIWVPIAIHFCFNGATVAMHLVARALDLPLPTDS